jgi:D-citramalate synthase
LSDTYTFVAQITAKYPTIHFDFHAHNDYDLSIANVGGFKSRCAWFACYCKRNGERAGNAPPESTVAVINDFMPEIEISVKNLHVLR